MRLRRRRALHYAQTPLLRVGSKSWIGATRTTHRFERTWLHELVARAFCGFVARTSVQIFDFFVDRFDQLAGYLQASVTQTACKKSLRSSTSRTCSSVTLHVALSIDRSIPEWVCYLLHFPARFYRRGTNSSYCRVDDDTYSSCSRATVARLQCLCDDCSHALTFL